MVENREKRMEKRLLAIHKRVQWISNREERAAWIGGYGAQGQFEQEREKLLSKAEQILDELSAPSKRPKSKDG